LKTEQLKQAFLGTKKKEVANPQVVTRVEGGQGGESRLRPLSIPEKRKREIKHKKGREERMPKEKSFVKENQQRPRVHQEKGGENKLV